MITELLRPLLHWLFWKRWRLVAVLVALILVIALIARLATGSSGAARPSAGGPADSTPATPATLTAPTASTVSPAAGQFSIYSWLPFTQQGLTAAAAVTVRFAVDYDTYSYTETAAAYVATMNGLITGDLASRLRANYQLSGVASLRVSQKQVSTGTAAISALRAFGPTSLTFVVTATQHLTSIKGASAGSTQYAVTVAGTGTSWQVSDIELASAGNS